MPVNVNYTIKDRKNKASNMSINAPSTFTTAQLIEFAQDIGQLFDNALHGRITKVGIVIDVPIPLGFKAVAFAVADVEEGALFGFKTVLNHPTKFRMASIDEDCIVEGSNVVDQAHAFITPILAAMTAGVVVTAGGGATVIPCDSRDEDIVALDYAVEAFQSS